MISIIFHIFHENLLTQINTTTILFHYFLQNCISAFGNFLNEMKYQNLQQSNQSSREAHIV